MIPHRLRLIFFGTFLTMFIPTFSQPISAAPTSPLQFKVIGDESYGESVTAIVLFKGGHFLLLQMLLTNAGIGDEKGACRVLFVPHQKSGWNEVERDGEDWSYLQKQNTLKISTCELKGAAKTTRFTARTDSMNVELTLNNPIKKVRPPGSLIQVKKDEHFMSEIMIPWAKVKAKISVLQKKWNLTGDGYLDHGRSNTLLPEVSRGWFRFRGFVGPSPFLLEVRTTPKGAHVGWIWSKGESKPTRLSSSTFASWKINTQRRGTLKRRDGDLKIPLPSVTLPWRGGLLKIMATQAIYQYEPAKAYGLMGRLAKSWVGDPITLTYAGRASWTQDPSQKTSQKRDSFEVDGVIEHIQIRD